MNFLTDFGVQPILLAAQVVNFLVLLFILKKFLYKPILDILQKRKEWIAKTVKNVEQSEKTLQETQEKANKIIEKSLEESRKILDESNKTGAQILEDTNKAAEEILKNAQKEALSLMDIERVKLKQEIREHLGDLAILVVEKITGKTINKKQQKELIEKAVKELS